MRAAVAALCAAVLAANAWHLLNNAAPPSWDDAWYLEVSFRLFQALKSGLRDFAAAYAGAFQIKAPLISVLPLPLYAAFGPSERLAVWINMALLPLTWLAILRIGTKLYGEKAGLCSVAAAALMPLLYGLSRLYLVECLLTCLVCCSVWALLEDKPRAVLIGLLFGLGLLAKSIFPLYVLGPLWLRRWALAPLAKPGLLVAALVAGTWYAFNWMTALGFGLSAGFGALGRDYGSFAWLSLSALSSFAAQFAGGTLSWPYLLGSAALIIYARPRWSEPARLLAAWFLLPAAALCLGVNKDARFWAPALPALALAAGAAAAKAGGTRAGRLLAGALAVPLLVLFSAQTFGVPAVKALPYNGPPSAEPGWDRRALVAAVAAHAEPGAVVAVGLEHPRLNANNLASLAAERGLPYSFVNLGYAQASVEGALIRLKDKGASHLVMARGVPAAELPGFLNRADAGLQERLDDGRLASTKLATVTLAPGVSAELHRLRR